MNISFSLLNSDDIPLLRKCLKEPHVAEFWQESEDEEKLRQKLLHKLQERDVRPYVIYLDNRPIGYIQAYEAHLIGGGWWPDAKPGTFGFDQFIGEPEFVNKGLGTKIIQAFVHRLFSFIPASSERFLLQAKAQCNPFDRNFVGIVRINGQSPSFDSLHSYLSGKYKLRPLVLVTVEDIFIIDYTRDSYWGFNPEPVFTMAEESLITLLKNDLKIDSQLIASERSKSNDEIRITYVAVTESCNSIKSVSERQRGF